MDNKKIGKLIATLRNKEGLTQQDLGDKIGVGFRAVSKWERGLNLPDIGITPNYKTFKGLNVIYTGQTKKSLKQRLNIHFQGIARRSTFRKSIGRLLNLTLIPYGDGKTSYSDKDESRISNWLQDSTICYYYINDTPDLIEQELINKFSPPLNIQKTTHLVSNAEYRDRIRQLRNE